MNPIIFCSGMFLSLTMLNCWWFLSMAKKLGQDYSSTTALLIDSGTLALGITLMYYAILI